MKRLLLAGLLVLPLALSRTGARADQDDAYGSLVSMADSAAGDRGPEAGAIPPDAPSMAEDPSAPAPSVEGAAPERVPSPVAAQARPSFPAAPAMAPKKEDDAPAVAAPDAAAPRVWTRVFASLLPPMRRESSFEVAASTSPRGPRPEAPRPSTPASAAGSAQGLLELVAAATAPSLQP